jgi:hypothetical protein
MPTALHLKTDNTPKWDGEEEGMNGFLEGSNISSTFQFNIPLRAPVLLTLRF